MPIQKHDIGTVTGAAGVNLTLTGVNVPAGATIFTAATNGEVNSNSPAPSDNVNGAYTSINEQLLGGGTLNGSFRMCFFPNSAPLNNATITFTRSGTGAGFGNSLSAFYVVGLGAIRNASIGGSFTNSVTTGASVAVGDLVVAAIGTAGVFSQDTNLPWAAPFDANSFLGGGTIINLTAGTVTYAPPVAGNSGTVIVAFAPGTGGGTTTFGEGINNPGLASVGGDSRVRGPS